jgi:hypothetical protein
MISKAGIVQKYIEWGCVKAWWLSYGGVGGKIKVFSHNLRTFETASTKYFFT